MSFACKWRTRVTTIPLTLCLSALRKLGSLQNIQLLELGSQLIRRIAANWTNGDFELSCTAVGQYVLPFGRIIAFIRTDEWCPRAFYFAVQLKYSVVFLHAVGQNVLPQQSLAHYR